MKKLIMLLMILPTMAAFGYTTCMRNNTYIAVFRPTVNGTSSESNNTNKIWKVVYDYITLTGYASCNDIAGTANTAKTNLVTGSQDVGTHCWCQMWPIEDYGYETGPSGYWMYLKEFTSESECANGTASVDSCTVACEKAMKSDSTFRTAVFEAMW